MRGALNGLEIAVVGLSLRFPGAENEHEFWQMLQAGQEAITRLDPQAQAPNLRNAPNYVPVAAQLAQPERFDAQFFGYTPREAQLIDPQQRVFLECCWRALEDAGYDCQGYPGLIGLFAGAGMNWYLESMRERPQFFNSISGFEKLITGDKDFLPTRVAYHLNLKGPAVNVQTACSTSLVAVHLACQALLSGDCDMALAGAVAISPYAGGGYLYEESMIMSPDGHCRAYDAQARGTVFSNGTAAVVLKRLSQALDDGDNIRAVIKGTAVNNDGSRKVGYTAPSVEGQAEVILASLRAAEFEPSSITYVEGHGTATELGDPVEVAALNKAFSQVPGRAVCGLGSVKSNFGHMDTVAGLAGLIKVILAMEHGQLPPSLHYRKPNPMIHFDQGPFYVVSSLTPWQPAGISRRAGVSSFGIGGTNAHVVLEEAPPRVFGTAAGGHQLLLSSARTRPALERSIEQLCSLPLDGDAAFTLATGRVAMARRAFSVAAEGATVSPADFHFGEVDPESGPPPVVLLFPGQGSQYPGMGRDLYEQEPYFRAIVDQCSGLLEQWLDYNLVEAIYGEDMAEKLNRPEYSTPALFTISYALARLLQHWGLPVAAVFGHSTGEYAAACVAGVFELEAALEAVARRGLLLRSLPPGQMLTVGQPAAEVVPLIGSELVLAAVNAPGSCVISGPPEAMRELMEKLQAAQISHRLLPTIRAFHSPTMEPIRQPYAEILSKLRLHPAKIPGMSCLTGDWFGPEQPQQAEYWLRQQQETARFSEGLERLAEDLPGAVLLEVGPGNSLTSLARLRRKLKFSAALPTLPAPQKEVSARAHLLGTLGQLWLMGQPLNWQRFYTGRRRVSLPGYPFEVDGQIYSVGAESAGPAREQEAVLYAPGWKRLPLAAAGRIEPSEWLVFCRPGAWSEEISAQFRGQGHSVRMIAPGPEFEPDQPEYYLRAVQNSGATRFLYALALGDGGSDFLQLIYLVQALQATAGSEARELVLVTDGLQEVVGEPVRAPERASILGLPSIIAQECARLSCRSVDLPASGEVGELVGQLLRELGAGPEHEPVAWRGGHRWVRTLEPLAGLSGPSPLRSGGVYLISGGTGDIGRVLAEYLAGQVQARLVLTCRRPDQDHSELIQSLESLGSQVLVCPADLSQPDQVAAAVGQARARFGTIHGFFHVAGCAGAALIHDCGAENSAPHFAAKLEAARLLEAALVSQDLDFIVYFSSLAALSGKPGMAAYAAANASLDAYCESFPAGRAPRRISINWGPWKEVGMLWRQREQAEAAALVERGLTNGQALAALERVLGSGLTRAAVTTAALGIVAPPVVTVARSVSRATVAPVALTPTQTAVLEIWQDLFGFEELGIEDDFFELGGHSLLATQILARVNHRLQVRLQLRSLFEARTVAQMATLIDNLLWAAQAPPTQSGELEEIVI